MTFLSNSIYSLFNRPKIHMPSIDGIRALAILFVVFGHVYTIQTPLFDGEIMMPSWLRHDYGVDMFFVISGFLIGSILIKDYQKNGSISYLKFYSRRFLRLMPVYIIVLLLGLYFMENWFYLLPDEGLPMIGDAQLCCNLGNSSNTENLWANLLYVNNFLPTENQYMLWTWSLAIEEQFYFIAPLLLAFILSKHNKKISFLLILFLLSFVIRYFVVYAYELFPYNYWNSQSVNNEGINYMKITFSSIYDNLYTRYGGLLVGVIGAFINVFYNEKVRQIFTKKSSIIYILISLIILVGVLFDINYLYFGNFADWAKLTEVSKYEKIYWATIVAYDRNLYSVAILVVIFYSIYNKGPLGVRIKNFLSSKIFYPIAQLSYSTYLVHWMLMFWFFPSSVIFLSQYIESNTIIFYLNGSIGILISFLGSLILYLLVERPCMEFRNSVFFKSFFDKKQDSINYSKN